MSESVKKNFDDLSPAKQWEWIIDHKHDVIQMDLDNDVTYVTIKGYQNEWVMKTDCGDRAGVSMLLQAIGINAFNV